MKKLFFFVIFPSLFFSCGVDRSKIIGKTTSTNPYGDYGIYGSIVLNGVKHTAKAVYYRNKALVYVLDDNSRFMDYYFSKFVDSAKLKNLPLGTDMEDIIKKFGDPAFGTYRSGDELSMQRGIALNHFGCIYLQKIRKYDSIFYKISIYAVLLNFDGNKKLVSIERSQHRE
jgi:hypothetical protein